MSRSYRHHPIIAITCSGYRRGEKKDKTIWHQKVRSVCNQILRRVKSQDDSLDIPFFPHKNDVEVYTWAKDGKQKIDPSRSLMYWTKDGYLKK